MNFTSTFHTKVLHIVQEIPFGKVMTYGQIAALCGNARAARIVGGIAHYGNPKLPWHRVVNKNGGLASGYPGGLKYHKMHLEKEGILVDEGYVIKIDNYLWQPTKK